MTLHIGWPQAAFLGVLGLQGLGFLTRSLQDETEGRFDAPPSAVMRTLVVAMVITTFELWLLWCGGFFGGSS